MYEESAPILHIHTPDVRHDLDCETTIGTTECVFALTAVHNAPGITFLKLKFSYSSLIF